MIVDEKDADGLKNTERLFLHLTSFVVQFRTTIKSQGVSAFRPAIFYLGRSPVLVGFLRGRIFGCPRGKAWR